MKQKELAKDVFDMKKLSEVKIYICINNNVHLVFGNTLLKLIIIKIQIFNFFLNINKM